MKLKGLGRGLDALLGADAQNGDRTATLPVGDLQPGKYQPRTHMDPASLNELADSIKARGVLQPILVRPLLAGGYEIVAGERRWRASQIAGLPDVPVLIREIADEAALAMALIENIQRENLNPLEEAAGIKRLVDEFEMTHAQAAEALGRSRAATTNLLRLLQLAPPVQGLLQDGKIDMGHARALLPLHRNLQVDIAHQVARQGLSVRETERLVKRALQPPPTRPAPDRDLLRLQEHLAEQLGAEVVISNNRRGGGQVTIRYDNLDQLDGILGRFEAP